MLKSIIGTKVGMTQIFDTAGNLIPVTVIAAGPCVITDIRTREKNGYSALQLGFSEAREKSLSKPVVGQFKKHNIAPKRYVREFRIDAVTNYQVGQEIKADIFKSGDYVDISGLTKGKGYAGTVKRHGFGGGPVSHGQSDRLRAPGSIGGQGPQRVLRGMRMAGHLGHEIVTIQRLEVVSVDPEKNMILVRGAVPGVNGGVIVLEQTVKRIKAKPVAAAKGAAEKKKAAPAKAAAKK